jgi:hypothetical protein
MNTDDFIDTIFANMKVIGMLQKNSKLCIRKGQLAIDTDDRFQGLRRWIYKDGRCIIIMHVRNTINNAIAVSKRLLKDEISTDLRDWTVLRMHEEMRACENGLQNLKTTYMEDSAMVAALDVLIERLRANYDDISRKYNSLMPIEVNIKAPA